MITEDNRKLNRSNNPPVETVFSNIDKMAEDNSDLAKLKKIGDAPGKPILQSNSYRMYTVTLTTYDQPRLYSTLTER